MIGLKVARLADVDAIRRPDELFAVAAQPYAASGLPL